MRLIVAITGASGVIYGKRLLEVLRSKNIETHLVISQAAERIIEYEHACKSEISHRSRIRRSLERIIVVRD